MKFRMDALHYALLAVLVLLVFYAASTYGMFKEAETLKQPKRTPNYNKSTYSRYILNDFKI